MFVKRPVRWERWGDAEALIGTVMIDRTHRIVEGFRPILDAGNAVIAVVPVDAVDEVVEALNFGATKAARQESWVQEISDLEAQAAFLRREVVKAVDSIRSDLRRDLAVALGGGFECSLTELLKRVRERRG